jgi:hypothetical protein
MLYVVSTAYIETPLHLAIVKLSIDSVYRQTTPLTYVLGLSYHLGYFTRADLVAELGAYINQHGASATKPFLLHLEEVAPIHGGTDPLYGMRFHHPRYFNAALATK